MDKRSKNLTKMNDKMDILKSLEWGILNNSKELVDFCWQKLEELTKKEEKEGELE